MLFQYKMHFFTIIISGFFLLKNYKLWSVLQIVWNIAFNNHVCVEQSLHSFLLQVLSTSCAMKVPNMFFLLWFLLTKSFPTLIKSKLSSSSLWTLKTIKLFKRQLVIIERRYVLIRFILEKILSLWALVAGATIISCSSTMTSLMKLFLVCSSLSLCEKFRECSRVQHLQIRMGVARVGFVISPYLCHPCINQKKKCYTIFNAFYFKNWFKYKKIYFFNFVFFVVGKKCHNWKKSWGGCSPPAPP